MKRLTALVYLAIAFGALLEMALPMTVIAAETESAMTVYVEANDSTALRELAKHSIERDMQRCAQREATIVAIRTQYEGSVEIDMLAKLIYREARGVKSDTEKAAVVWCVLNRVDDSHHPNTIKKVITQKHQFAWRNRTPVQQKFKDLALDVVIRWELEKRGFEDVGRILPSDYLFFAGRRGHNWFRNKYRSRRYWDWSLYSPYDNGDNLLSVSAPTDGAVAVAFAARAVVGRKEMSGMRIGIGD